MENNLFKEGDILVTDMTDPDWEPLMKFLQVLLQIEEEELVTLLL